MATRGRSSRESFAKEMQNEEWEEDPATQPPSQIDDPEEPPSDIDKDVSGTDDTYAGNESVKEELDEDLKHIACFDDYDGRFLTNAATKAIKNRAGKGINYLQKKSED